MKVSFQHNIYQNGFTAFLPDLIHVFQTDCTLPANNIHRPIVIGKEKRIQVRQYNWFKQQNLHNTTKFKTNNENTYWKKDDQIAKSKNVQLLLTQERLKCRRRGRTCMKCQEPSLWSKIDHPSLTHSHLRTSSNHLRPRR